MNKTGGFDTKGLVQQLTNLFLSETEPLSEKIEHLSEELKHFKESTTGQLAKPSTEQEEFGFIDDTNKLAGVDIDTNLLTPVKGSDLSEKLIDILNLLTIKDINKESPRTSIVGSYKWKALKYPGDIDMLEPHTVEASNIEEAKEKISNDLAQVARDIEADGVAMIGDFKSGFDNRFDGLVESLGHLKADYINRDMIEYFEKQIPGYNRAQCEAQLKTLYGQGALDDGLYQKLLGLLPQGVMTGADYLKIFDILRKIRLLRWTSGDLINKFLVIQPRRVGGQPHIVYLKDAINMDTVTKLDLWAPVNGRWTEITNIFLFFYKNSSDGKTYPIGFQFKTSMEESTAIDITYYSDPSVDKPYKLSKRIWNRALLTVAKALNEQTGQIDASKIDPTQWHIMKLLFPLFSTDINILSQLSADIELFNTAIEKQDLLNITYDKMFKSLLQQIEGIPEKVFRIMLIDNELKSQISQSVSEIMNFVYQSVGANDLNAITNEMWNQKMDHEKMEQLSDMLDKLYKLMKSHHDAYVKQYLIRTKTNPREKDSVVQFNYSWNYLNLPPVQLSQSGGARSNPNSDYWKMKYLKYKAKYMRLQSNRR